MSDKDKTTSLLGLRPQDVERRSAPALIGLGEGVPLLSWLRKRETVLGRGGECDVHIDVRGVSREHAKLVLSSSTQVSLVDLRARNGTFVNGTRITDVTILREGDELHLGPLAPLRFTCRLVEGAEMPALERLTAREKEIAVVVARGLTNAAVAEQLGLKSRTVASHLEHIYGKLGISSRAELVRIVVESGL